MALKKIVTIGGGNGQSRLLRALVKYPKFSGLTAVVSMADNGGSTGRLCEQYAVLPPGDVRRCLLALSANEDVEQIWNYRFNAGDLKGHVLGNIWLTAAALQCGSFQEAIDQTSRLLQTRGEVLAVTDKPAQLVATLENGQEIFGEHAIDVPTHDASLAMESLRLEPVVETTARVREALAAADLVVLTMGDLFTSIVPNLLVRGVNEAILQSAAKVVGVCNRVTKNGETQNFSQQDYLCQLQKYLAPARLDVFIVDNGARALPDGKQGFKACATEKGELSVKDVKIIVADLAEPAQSERVDADRVAKIIYELCQSL